MPLLAAFAIPAALADELLPVVDRGGRRRRIRAAAAARRPGPPVLRALRAGCRPAVALVAVAVLLAVGLGSGAAFVGTAGRFDGGGGGQRPAAIGLSPFTSLRGQLTDAAPAELFAGARPATGRCTCGR